MEQSGHVVSKSYEAYKLITFIYGLFCMFHFKSYGEVEVSVVTK